MLQLKNYSISADKKDILKDINFTFEEGKTYAIMGPNGSGKSTLALSVAGAPQFVPSNSSELLFEDKKITSLAPEKRSAAGLFVTMQSPPSLSGVTVFQLLRTVLSQLRQGFAGQAGKMSALDVRTKISEIIEKLSISPELLKRSLNDGFSGGERKKFEVLQMAMLEPKLVFFDEIDTGVDVDALKTISTFLKKNKKENQTYIFITHNTRILEYLKPDTVLIMKDGQIVKTGTAELAKEIEENGYTNV